MKNKKAIMGFAAILILVFHFYIPVTNWKYETLLAKISYIGVDLFFFVSAYSLSKSRIDSYLSYLKRRFSKVYIRFFILTLIAAVVNGYGIIRILKILSGKEFFSKGGGAFLWFVIAIMITYLIIPPIRKLKEKLGIKALPLLLLGWAIITSICQYVFDYTTINIYLNRLPVILAGLYYDDLRYDDKKGRMVIDCFLLAFSICLLFRFGALQRLNVPFEEMFYVFAIPAVISVVDIMDSAYGIMNLRVLNFIGGFTLELYGLQMIFGYRIENFVYRLVPNGFFTFLFTAIILVIMAYLFNKAYELIEKRIKK